MSARPKLPAAIRAEIVRVVNRRRELTKLIAKLTEEKRAIPDNKTLAEQLNVCYSVVRRTLHGDPYRNTHRDDESLDAREQRAIARGEHLEQLHDHHTFNGNERDEKTEQQHNDSRRPRVPASLCATDAQSRG